MLSWNGLEGFGDEKGEGRERDTTRNVKLDTELNSNLERFGYDTAGFFSVLLLSLLFIWL